MHNNIRVHRINGVLNKLQIASTPIRYKNKNPLSGKTRDFENLNNYLLIEPSKGIYLFLLMRFQEAPNTFRLQDYLFQPE